jgi:hypothetical protein
VSPVATPTPIRSGAARTRASRARRPHTAFVLSGGASLGALQVGMLRALYERGIAADLLVGTSVGALNAAVVASRPQTPATADELARTCGRALCGARLRPPDPGALDPTGARAPRRSRYRDLCAGRARRRQARCRHRALFERSRADRPPSPEPTAGPANRFRALEPPDRPGARRLPHTARPRRGRPRAPDLAPNNTDQSRLCKRRDRQCSGLGGCDLSSARGVDARPARAASRARSGEGGASCTGPAPWTSPTIHDVRWGSVRLSSIGVRRNTRIKPGERHHSPQHR